MVDETAALDILKTAPSSAMQVAHYPMQAQVNQVITRTWSLNVLQHSNKQQKAPPPVLSMRVSLLYHCSQASPYIQATTVYYTNEYLNTQATTSRITADTLNGGTCCRPATTVTVNNQPLSDSKQPCRGATNFTTQYCFILGDGSPGNTQHHDRT